MATKNIKEEIIKEPRTIKVSTVVTWTIMLLLIVATFISGWHLSSLHAQDIEAKSDAKAHAIVQLSKEQ